MESRKVEGQLAVRGLLGNGWVYLSAAQNGLRIVNVPDWVDEDLLRRALNVKNHSIRVFIRGTRGRVRLAHASVDEDTVNAILRAPARELEAIATPEPEDVVQKWMSEYESARNAKAVREWADAAMETYELRERKREEARKRLEEQGADNDGFVTVVNGPSVEEAASAVQEKAERGIEKDGFYRWQKKRKLDVQGLRERFAEDRKRVRAAAALKLTK